MNTESKLTTGEKLKDLRKKTGLTSEQLCSEIEKRYGYIITKSKYNEIENDKDKDFGFKSFLYLAKFYNVTIDYLLGLSSEPTTIEDEQIALKVTGLSGKALENIRVLCGTSPTTWKSNLSHKAVMFMLESEQIIEIARKLGEVEAYQKILAPSPELIKAMLELEKTNPKEEIRLAISAIVKNGNEGNIKNAMGEFAKELYDNYRKELENG